MDSSVHLDENVSIIVLCTRCVILIADKRSSKLLDDFKLGTEVDLEVKDYENCEGGGCVYSKHEKSVVRGEQTLYGGSVMTRGDIRRSVRKGGEAIEDEEYNWKKSRGAHQEDTLTS